MYVRTGTCAYRYLCITVLVTENYNVTVRHLTKSKTCTIYKRFRHDKIKNGSIGKTNSSIQENKTNDTNMTDRSHRHVVLTQFVVAFLTF